MQPARRINVAFSRNVPIPRFARAVAQAAGQDSSSTRLTIAAHELVHAAAEATNNSSLALSKDAIDELRHLHSALDQVSTKLDKVLVEGRMQRLQWAMQNAHIIRKFEYCIFNSDGTVKYHLQSADLAVQFFAIIMEGHGRMDLPNPYGILPTGATSTTNLAECEKLFQEKFIRQIHGLTGIKPTFKQNAVDAKYPLVAEGGCYTVVTSW